MINILLTLDKKYVQHLHVMLVSLFENNKERNFVVYIFSDNLSTETQNEVQELSNQYKQNIVFYDLNIDDIQHFNISNHASLANYYRIIACKLLPQNIRQILYMDVDLLVLKNIKTLYSINLESNLLGVISEVGKMEEQKKILNIPNDKQYFNSGIMLINLKKWQDEKWTEKLINYINQNPDKLMFWDQDALNAMCYGQCIYLDNKWNMQATMFENNKDSKQNFQNTAIMHFTGSSKPWQYMNKHPYKYLYYQYLKKTIFKNFVPPDKTIGNFLRKYKLMPKIYDKLSKKINKA
ncbi:MAG: glycosyltransferase family 8 protein [Cytophagales bacterium]|nr:MAG: glycosyltransferase family 8 protein [Cytophagales bacterium]